MDQNTGTTNLKCELPPPDGYAACTRVNGHSGPCALPVAHVLRDSPFGIPDGFTGGNQRSAMDWRHQPFDIVQKPAHYNTHPSGVETIDVVREMPFSLGNAVKYIMRAPYKGSREQDYRKAFWYLKDAVDKFVYATGGDGPFYRNLADRVMMGEATLPFVLEAAIVRRNSPEDLRAALVVLGDFIKEEFPK